MDISTNGFKKEAGTIAKTLKTIFKHPKVTLAVIGTGAAGLGAQLGQQYGATAGQTMVGGTGNLAGLYAQQGEYYPWMAASLNQSLQGALGNYYFKQFLDKYGGGNATT